MTVIIYVVRIVEGSLDHQNVRYFIGRKKFNNATQQWRRLFKLNISREIDVILFILRNLITKTHRDSERSCPAFDC